MKLKKNDSITLRTPRFLVDNPLNDELEKYEVFKHINRASVTAFIGTSGSGKTSLMYSLLMNTNPKIWKKQFESIIVVMPRASRNSLKNNIFDKYLDADSLYDSLSEEAIDIITSMIERNAEEGLHTLLILDDVASSLKNAYIAKKLQHLVYAYRHFRLNILMLVQTMKTIPLAIRKNMTNIVIFHKPRLSEWDAIVSEFLELDPKRSEDLYKTVFREKYDWTLVNLNSGRVYAKFDEVMYRDAEED